ncbi:MAG: arginine--tRNA ligase [Candidatus Sericytochromatia bacterium]|nr:arginine--tRNA ligase [Candidatus Sericytochromatia bacterium]
MIQASLAQHVIKALQAAQNAQELTLDSLPSEIKIETPRDPSHGDYASNIAMSLAKSAKLPPRKLAEILLPHLQGPLFQEVSIAGPGFINFRLSQAWLLQQLQGLIQANQGFGQQTNGDPETYLIEYVSANPTGPLHFGHGRWAVLGDCLARLMRLAGYSVKTEFYINDTGAQVNNLGASVQACYFQAAQAAGQTLDAEALTLIETYLAEKNAETKGQVQFYHGQYIQTLGLSLFEHQGPAQLAADLGYFSDYAKSAILAEQQAQLKQFGVVFDEWFPESRLHHEQAVAEALKHLKESGKTYEQDGALWFRSSDYGDDQDRVLVKQTGSNTYFANDIAYHWDKLRRGHTRLINLWGADHHGYIARMSAAIQALGYPKEALQVLLGQMVNLFRNGEKVRMSKRTGDMISFGEVLEEVGTDATRFLLMQRSADVTLDFDLELAKSQNSENPVFYVQYAHARICSIFRNAANLQAYDATAWPQASLEALVAPEERILLLKLLSYPDELKFAASQREPHRLATYAQDLAALFHSFYKQCRVLFEKEDVTSEEIALSLARLNLVKATQVVLRNVLVDVFGISAPEVM